MPLTLNGMGPNHVVTAGAALDDDDDDDDWKLDGLG